MAGYIVSLIAGFFSVRLHRPISRRRWRRSAWNFA